MAKSLNNAFIRAYSKKGSENSDPEQQAEETKEYLVRYDTASIEVPAPHLGRVSNTKPAVVQDQTDLQERTEEEPTGTLRASIADQMQQASTWEDAPIDAFSGGFPVATASEATTQPTATHSGEAKSTAPVAQPASTLASPPSNSIAANPSKSQDSSHPGEPSPDANASMSPQDVHRIVQDYVERHGRDGEIFRLDRPTYSEDVEDGQEAVSDSLSNSNEPSRTDFDIEEESTPAPSATPATPATPAPSAAPAPSAPPTSVAPPAPSASVAEEQLREVADTSFTPVWEVDRFQWPKLHNELLDRAQTALERVASNLQTACEEGLSSLAVTSPHAGQGCSTVACCLARVAASHGLRIALLDANLENPTLSFQANIEVDEDWFSALQTQHSLEEIAVRSIEDQFTLIPLRNTPPAKELPSSDSRIATMINELTQNFDLVLIDAGAMNSPHNLVPSLGEQDLISAVLCVVADDSQDVEIEFCIEKVKQLGVRSVGLVENFVE